MQLCPATVLKCQEAIPISNNEMRKIHRGGEEQPARPVGRKVNVSQSRREVHSAAENRTRTPKAPKSPKPPKEKSKHPILRFIGRTVATVLCLGIMLGSVVAVGMVFYVVQATANDGDLLDLDNIQLSQSSMVVATTRIPAHRWSMPPCAPPTATAYGQTLSRFPPICSMPSSAPRIRTSTQSPALTSSAPSAQ